MINERTTEQHLRRMAPRGEVMSLPLAVAPFDSCIACFKGDVSTGVALYGPEEWHIAAMRLWGIPGDQASAALRFFDAENPGSGGGPFRVYRICPRCAGRADMAPERTSQISRAYCVGMKIRPIEWDDQHR